MNIVTKYTLVLIQLQKKNDVHTCLLECILYIMNVLESRKEK